MQANNAQKQENSTLKGVILDNARILFAEYGYSKVSMRKLAHAIGYSPTTIYHHFKDKKEIFLHITEEIYKEFLVVINEILLRPSSPKESLKQILHTMVNMGIENPYAYRVGFMMETDFWSNPQAHFENNPFGRSMYKRIGKCVKNCMHKKASNEEIKTTTHAVIAATHGLTALLVTYPNFDWGPVENLKKTVIDSAVDGI